MEVITCKRIRCTQEERARTRLSSSRKRRSCGLFNWIFLSGSRRKTIFFLRLYDFQSYAISSFLIYVDLRKFNGSRFTIVFNCAKMFHMKLILECEDFKWTERCKRLRLKNLNLKSLSFSYERNFSCSFWYSNYIESLHFYF